MKTPERINYEEQEHLHGIIPKKSYEYVTNVNESTIRILGKTWTDNLERNKRYWRKNRKLLDTLGIGKNKCVIGIGSGMSFNKNKDTLKQILNEDGVKDWPDRRYITIAANHQFKPLMDMGIIPDFVLLVDASDVVMDQLTKGIPQMAKHVSLICGIHCSPKVIAKWTRQGRPVLFYTTPIAEFDDMFKKIYNRDPTKHKMDLGGNVLNGAWMVGITRFRSNVFFGVGNDLSFELKETIEDQRKTYYSDGDYSTNAKETGTGRDEAASEKKWAGFSLTRRSVWLPGESQKGLNRYNISLDTVGTNHTLWVYKTWLEATILGQLSTNGHFHYFNCSEGGILGVMAKEDDDESLKRDSNWFMLDQVAVNKNSGAAMYHTAMLEDAHKVYLKAKEMQRWPNAAIRTDVQDAGVLVGTGRNTIAQNVI